MVPRKKIQEIREFLNNARKPLFFYDDDPDGLASYLLLKRKIKKGYGVALKSGPGNESLYVRKVKEYNPDIVFILDKPVVSQETLDKINKPIVWIDHHEPLKRNNVIYFNPLSYGEKDGISTSYWCYQVVEQDLWIALVGICGDWNVPIDLIKKFEHKELLGKPKEPGDILYNSKYGVLVNVFSFILKGRTSEVRKCVETLAKIESPIEILKQTTSKGNFIWKRYEKVGKEFNKLKRKAMETKADGKMFIFTYPSGTSSFTGILSNELMYRNKSKVVVVGRIKEEDVIMSVRSSTVKIRDKFKASVEKANGYGGGHEFACGGSVPVGDFHKFLEDFSNKFKKK